MGMEGVGREGKEQERNRRERNGMVHYCIICNTYIYNEMFCQTKFKVWSWVKYFGLVHLLRFPV